MLRVAALQLQAFKDKIQCLSNTEKTIDLLMNRFPEYNQPELLVLPECFNMLYTGNNFQIGAENFSANGNSPSLELIQSICRKYKTHLVTSLAEYDSQSNEYFNTAIIVDTQGQIVSKYRKLHLFEIAMKSKFQMNEREWLSPGNLGIQTYTIKEGIDIGLAICYDLRFSEQFILMKQKTPNLKLIVVPGCFNMYTGPLHWELLLRTRALDTQCYTIGCSMATYKINQQVNNIKNQYKMYYGHSMIADSDGRVIQKLKDLPGVICQQLDFEQQNQIRNLMPIHEKKREEVYKINNLSSFV